MARITMAAMAEALAAQRAEMAELRAEVETLRAGLSSGARPADLATADPVAGPSPARDVTRRRVMLAAVGAAAGLAAATVRPEPAAAASGGAFILGQSNAANAISSLQSGADYTMSLHSSSTTGTALLSQADATSGQTTGIYARSSSTAGTGILGIASATTGLTYGVVGQVNSAAGYALYGKGRLKVTGRSFLATPVGAPATADLSNGSISFYLDQIANRLRIKVKYSTGVVKYGSIALG